MSTENTPSETQEMIREIASIFKDFTEAEAMTARFRRSIRGDYDQLMDDIEKEEANKCETR